MWLCCANFCCMLLLQSFCRAHAFFPPLVQQLQPLKGIQVGRGLCNPGSIDNSKNACGGPTRGRCNFGKVCECFIGWTGPHCLTHLGFDNQKYDQPDKISDLGFSPPRVAPMFLIVAICALGFFMLIVLQWRHRFDGWTPIPDAHVSSKV